MHIPREWQLIGQVILALVFSGLIARFIVRRLRRIRRTIKRAGHPPTDGRSDRHRSDGGSPTQRSTSSLIHYFCRAGRRSNRLKPVARRYGNAIPPIAPHRGNAVPPVPGGRQCRPQVLSPLRRFPLAAIVLRSADRPSIHGKPNLPSSRRHLYAAGCVGQDRDGLAPITAVSSVRPHESGHYQCSGMIHHANLRDG